MIKLFPLALLLLTWVSGYSENKLSKDQEKWFKFYKKQKNAPTINEMKLNKDKEPDLTKGFVNLYNKKDLSGWNIKGGKCKFEAKGDVIVGTCVKGSPSTDLTTVKKYKNFIFTCEIKWVVDINSGISFRSRLENIKGVNSLVGPQAEMEGFKKGRDWSGGIYGQHCGGFYYPLWLEKHKEARAALNQEIFNRITIKANKQNVKTWVNGIPVANWDNEEHQQGHFGLQVHSGEKGIIHFRNIKIKEL